MSGGDHASLEPRWRDRTRQFLLARTSVTGALDDAPVRGRGAATLVILPGVGNPSLISTFPKITEATDRANVSASGPELGTQLGYVDFDGVW